MDTLRKELLYRSEHRGMREADFLIGGFARAHLETMSEEDLREFQTILEIPDQDLMQWCLGFVPVPEDHQGVVLERMIEYVQRTP